jgi:hypothetical protein
MEKFINKEIKISQIKKLNKPKIKRTSYFSEELGYKVFVVSVDDTKEFFYAQNKDRNADFELLKKKLK